MLRRKKTTTNGFEPSRSHITSQGNSRITVGRFTYGYEKLRIREWGEGSNLEIGQFCSIADDVTIFLGGNHRTDYISTFPFGHVFQDLFGDEKVLGHPHSKGDVLIGNDVWIGSGVTILSGVSIGDGAVLAAKSLISGDVGPYEIFGGNPAKLIRERFNPEIVKLLQELAWWDLNLDEINGIREMLGAKPSKVELRRALKELRKR